MRVQRKYFERDEKRELKEVKAIVIHWPGPKKTIDGYRTQDITYLWKWMNDNTTRSYHFLVSQEKVIQCRDTRYRSIHCGHVSYRKKAKDFFGGNICSAKNSPNNYTIAVCMLHDFETGGYGTKTIDTAVDLLAHLCIDNNLDPGTELLRHSDITNEKKVPCPLGFFEDDDDPDDLWNSFKYWVAAKITQLYREVGIVENLEQKYDIIGKEK